VSCFARISKRALFLYLILFSSTIFPNDGWFEVTRGLGNSALEQNNSSIQGTDQLWVPMVGETLADIAKRATGSSAHAFTIGRYNNLDLNQALPKNVDRIRNLKFVNLNQSLTKTLCLVELIMANEGMLFYRVAQLSQCRLQEHRKR